MRVDPFGLDWIDYPDMSDFPDDPSDGKIVLDDGTIVTGDFRINPEGGANGKSNPSFGTDISSIDYFVDQYMVFLKIKNDICEKTCCDKEKCAEDAFNVSQNYVSGVKKLRNEFLDMYGWVGKGWSGNSANWRHSSGNEKNRRKYNYYFRKKAPGPLCHEWADQIIHSLSETYYKCLGYEPNQTAEGTPFEHNFVTVHDKTEPSNKVKLDPWKTARAKAY